MQDNLRNMLKEAVEAWGKLSAIQKAGLGAALLVMLILFFAFPGGGEKNSASSSEDKFELKPYRPAGQILAAGPEGAPLSSLPAPQENLGQPLKLPPGLTDRIESLEGSLTELKESLSNLSDAVSRLEKEFLTPSDASTEISGLKDAFERLSGEMAAIRKDIKTSREVAVQEAPVKLIAMASSRGLNYAVLSYQGGDIRVAEGDKVGPWMVEEIGPGWVRLSARGYKRVLRMPG